MQLLLYIPYEQKQFVATCLLFQTFIILVILVQYIAIMSFNEIIKDTILENSKTTVNIQEQ